MIAHSHSTVKKTSVDDFRSGHEDETFGQVMKMAQCTTALKLFSILKILLSD